MLQLVETKTDSTGYKSGLLTIAPIEKQISDKIRSSKKDQQKMYQVLRGTFLTPLHLKGRKQYHSSTKIQMTFYIQEIEKRSPLRRSKLAQA